jgi:hypothetical protein
VFARTSVTLLSRPALYAYRTWRVGDTTLITWPVCRVAVTTSGAADVVRNVTATLFALQANFRPDPVGVR